MDALTSTILRCNLQVKLDNNTEGYGNCFPNAIVQQCRRPEIRKWLQENMQESLVYNQQTLRNRVANFAIKSKHQTVNNYKTNYENLLARKDKKSWKQYWAEMVQAGCWVDSVFVQLTAWFLRLDILILTTSSTRTEPFIRITGNLSNTLEFSSGPPLLLANYTNVHYQSLLPLNITSDHGHQPSRSSEENHTDNSRKEDFVYINKGQTLAFQSIEADKLQCPVCGKSFQRLMNHITSKACNIYKMNMDINELRNQLQAFK